MAFGLTEKLQDIFKGLKGKGLITEEDLNKSLKEIKMALLEADVSFKVVKTFIKNIKEKTLGTDVLKGLNPAQSIIKIVNDEMTSLMGNESKEIKLNNGLTTIMMVGLQGAGKTTTASKIAAKFKKKGRKPLLVACDIYRPAAIEQLKVNAKKVDVDFFEEGKKNPVEISKDSIEFAKKNGYDLVIIDTAGRLQIDEQLMEELIDIKDSINIDFTILTLDAMLGQEAINVATTFDEKLDINGMILTKLDGDTRGGVALSVAATLSKPIYYVGMGEKLSDLEQFYPDRMASRILGMGDMLSLIDKLQEELDVEDIKPTTDKKDFDLEDFLEGFKQMNKLGGISSILGFMPNMKGLDVNNLNVDEKQLKRTEAIILSMTRKERQNPSILNASRRRRIANGAGVTVQDVNILIKNFEQSKNMMKMMQNPKTKKHKKFPFGF